MNTGQKFEVGAVLCVVLLGGIHDACPISLTGEQKQCPST